MLPNRCPGLVMQWRRHLTLMGCRGGHLTLKIRPTSGTEQQRLLLPCDLLNEAAVPAVVSFDPAIVGDLLPPSPSYRLPCVLYRT
jgi:hypothetical protein